MVIKGIIKTGQYYDSVTLMIVAGKIRKLDNIIDSSIVMGTMENRSILKTANLLISEFETCKDSDLLIVVSAKTTEDANTAINKADDFLKDLKNKKSNSNNYQPKSIAGAKDIIPNANLALISVAGKFAYNEAMTALEENINVMLFSDNVSIEEELQLKQYADKNNLIVMGPDCGTAIINSVPLAFANSISTGDIGIVAASGTGLQEVSSLISNFGEGISHAIGTGGRDVKEAIGGISFLKGMELLAQDKSTKIIVLISKPPHQNVLKKIETYAKTINKPIVSIFLGSNIKLENIKATATLEEAAIMACELSSGKKIENSSLLNNDQLQKNSNKLKSNLNSSQKYIRALYTGGTFCSETQLILKNNISSNIFSNAPVKDISKLENSLISKEHTIIDLGEDEFTKGRPHPMIDFTLRNKRILEEVKNKEVAVILLDLVIGYGANMNPLEDFIPTVKEARSLAPKLPIICFITGTNNDPQNKTILEQELKNIDIEVVYSNSQAANLASMIIS